MHLLAGVAMSWLECAECGLLNEHNAPQPHPIPCTHLILVKRISECKELAELQ